MKALIAITLNGARHLIMVVPKEFDTQTWANSRIEAFKLLEVERILDQDSWT